VISNGLRCWSRTQRSQDQARLYEGILDAGLMRQLIQRQAGGTFGIGRFQEGDSMGQNRFDGARSPHGPGRTIEKRSFAFFRVRMAVNP
jgi:hypothetical protein